MKFLIIILASVLMTDSATFADGYSSDQILAQAIISLKEVRKEMDNITQQEIDALVATLENEFATRDLLRESLLEVTALNEPNDCSDESQRPAKVSAAIPQLSRPRVSSASPVIKSASCKKQLEETNNVLSCMRDKMFAAYLMANDMTSSNARNRRAELMEILLNSDCYETEVTQ